MSKVVEWKAFIDSIGTEGAEIIIVIVIIISLRFAALCVFLV